MFVIYFNCGVFYIFYNFRSWLKYEDEFSTYNLDESQSSPNQKMAPSYHTQYLLSKLLKTKRGKSLSLDTFRKMVITKLKKIEDEETS